MSHRESIHGAVLSVVRSYHPFPSWLWHKLGTYSQSQIKLLWLPLNGQTSKEKYDVVFALEQLKTCTWTHFPGMSPVFEDSFARGPRARRLTGEWKDGGGT